MRVLSLFSGIGSPEQALKNLGINFELVGFSEIDKFAIKSYCRVHNVNESLNLGDITKIDINKLDKDINLITHGSPCQDFSVGGKGNGGDLGSGTRSSLMWNTVAICEHIKPKYVLWENVKNVISKKHIHNFDKYISEMERIGYTNYYKVLNAKNFGVPQNRERIFVISIRNDIEKDFKFPQGIQNNIRLKDILESEVDEKYYIDTEKAKQLIINIGNKIDLEKQCIGTCHKNNDLSKSTRDLVYNENKLAPCLSSTMYKDAPKVLVRGNINPSEKGLNGNVIDAEGLCSTLTTNKGEGIKILTSERLGGMFDDEKGKHQAGSVWDIEQLAPTLDTMQGGYRQPCIMVRQATKKGYDIAYEGDSVNIEQPSSLTRRGRVGKQIANTINTTNTMCVVRYYRLRKLTPLECWRLMGFKDEEFKRAAEVCSNSQLYKQAGNSIVVNVLEDIFRNLLEGEDEI